ncbi:MAG: UDP-N-acetylglucosamine--N-acetylmuramyl-(pentapeptide) pyrophosphoryl-undecaprenol N-acetylglucosamine transferase [Candidatus Omnitrophica bacterium]|nr:UDP-N-acetylglucosamine--N-acetylmuramyl-(pentapeptide) pyrophosphoryl-undecaprenol N-acetylglucosamine transferase [Candidatus Omnitrophota bacterium]
MRTLIACGGTAGHIFPGLALAEQLQTDNRLCRITIVVSTHPRDQQYLRANTNFETFSVATVPACGLPYKFSLKYFPFIGKFIMALLKSFYIIFRYRPQVVVGFGGYASFAPLLAARMLGIPTLIHEQNYLPGRANQLLARITNRVAISFDESVKYFRSKTRQNRIIKTGFPLRKQILQKISAGPKTGLGVLVLGGSQGAHNINELVLNAFSKMNKAILAKIQITHLSGKNDFSYVKKSYADLDIQAQVFDFLTQMQEAYRAADVLIGRSGAGTIFEAANFGLACLLIPHSGGTNHQQENARYLQRLGATLVLDENTASSDDFANALLELITNKRLRQDLSNNINSLNNFRAEHDLQKQVNDLYNSHYVYR